MRSTKVMLGCKKVVTFEDFEVRKFAPLPYKANVTLAAVRMGPSTAFCTAVHCTFNKVVYSNYLYSF